ncbi:ABC transporter ATP-binding protein [Alcaligenaceae bacterium SJ-26]|nr:ABC transporter ATP-binding protein [Alcaligenaceae bacterium SJ-26]
MSEHPVAGNDQRQPPVLAVTDLTVCYGKVHALTVPELKVAPGAIVTVIGANGAGKSTMLNAIMGSLPRNGRASGFVRYQNDQIEHWGVEHRVAQGLALVPEKRELFGSMSVEDNLLLGGFRRYRAGERQWRDSMDEVFTLFPRLKERRQQMAGTLSGGERQMLAVGRALMSKPSVLMLDEPSLGLAPRIVREIFHIIAGLRATGVATLLVEQNARAALQVADYGYVLEAGAVSLEGPAHELRDNPAVIESYLGLGKHRDD